MARKKTPKPAPLPSHAEASLEPLARGEHLPVGYPGLLEDLKTRIRSAQLKAAVSVNRELITLYWQIGQAIVERQRAEGWGKAIIERLARDLRAAFPGVSGFSPQNLWYMRSFYLAWTEEVAKLQQPVGVLDGIHLPEAAAGIPWGHNLQLFSKLDNPVVRLWYARKCVEHGWSRAVLVHQIESGAYKRQGQALTNFERTLPAPQSDLAREVLKDPYNFGFLTLAEDAKELELQRGLLQHLRDFLIELGVGFAFVGSRYPLIVGGEEYYLDLLFYHLRLRSFIVIELKVDKFEPEHAGKLNFYLSAVDDLLRHPTDQPSIGLILCKEKNRVIVEYALRDTNKPMGVASYEVQRGVLPEGLRECLPSIERIEDELRHVAEGEQDQGDTDQP